MKGLNFWEGFKNIEIRGIPIVCDACGEQVSVNGDIQEGELVFEPCPGCGASISGMLFMQGDEEVEETKPLRIRTFVTWFTESGLIPSVSVNIGPMLNVLELLMLVLGTGVRYYTSTVATQQVLYYQIALTILKSLLPAELVLELHNVAEELLKTPAGEDFTVLEGGSGGNGGVPKGPELKDILGEVDKEDKEDDE